MHSNEVAETVLVTLPVPVLILDRRGTILRFNDCARELFGALTPVAGLPDAKKELERCARAALASASPGDFPLQAVLTLDSATGARTFDLRCQALCPASPTDAAYSVVLLEVTRFGADPEGFRWGEGHAQRLLDHLPSIVWSVDTDLCFTACEGGLLKQFDSYPERVVGRLLEETFGPDGAEATTIAAHRRALAGETVTYECSWGGRRFYSLVAPLGTEGKEAIGVALDITERVQEEDAVRRSRDAAECLVQTANVLIVGLDVQGRVTVFNEAAERSTGYSAREILGRNWFDLGVPRAERQSLCATYTELLGSEGRTTFTSPMVTRSGQRRLVAWRSSVIRNDAEVVGTLSVGQDVTDLIATQDRLRDSEERHRTLLSSLPQRIFVKDQEGAFVSVNEPFARDFGLRPKDLIGKSDFDFFDRELAEKYRADDRRVMETCTTVTLVEANVVQDRARFVEVVKAPVITDGGEVLGVVGVFTDITERKRMELELARERDLLHTLMENIPDQIFFKDRESRFTRVNPAAARAIGFAEPEAVVGLTDFDVHPADLAEGFYADDQRLLSSGEPIIGKLETQRFPDGTERWLSTTKVPIRDLDGRVVGIAGISRDMSERIQAEATLRRTAAELARSNEELQQFAYVASHDLQEPLRMVASYTQLLARRYRDKLDEDGLEFINFAVDGATRMQGLIQDLLAYSRVGTRGNEFSPVSLEVALERGLANLKVGREETQAVVTHDALPTAWGDLGQLAQLFQNLVGNAIKFRRADPPRIHVSARRQGAEWIVSVEDNGIGIEAEYAERIFVIFQRLHGKAEYPGSGIGLSICKKIVNRHGGKIWVEGRPGSGSTFHFTLPADPSRKDRTVMAEVP